MNIGLLQCDHVAEPFRHIVPDYSEQFANLFSRHAPAVSLRVYDVCHGELPASVDECAGYVISGSKYSVYDDIPWIHELAAFVRKLHENRRKLVGVCFGHQMIAHALGGEVKKTGRGWGIGVKPVQIKLRRSWMQPERETYNLLLSHQDQVEALPPDAEALGGNDHCPYSIFTVGEHFLGIQAHPEFIKPYAEALMGARVDRIGQTTVDAAKETLGMPTDEAAVTRWMETFLKQPVSKLDTKTTQTHNQPGS